MILTIYLIFVKTGWHLCLERIVCRSCKKKSMLERITAPCGSSTWYTRTRYKILVPGSRSTTIPCTEERASKNLTFWNRSSIYWVQRIYAHEFGTPPGILDSLSYKLPTPFHWLKKFLLLLKIKAADHQRLQGKGFVNNAVFILPSIDCVLWMSCLIDNPALPKNL